MDLIKSNKKELPSYKMSLLRFIHHAPVGAPTYFDLLPVDVLRCFIIPFLGWEDRIHLNMLTPPGDRTPPNKIPKDRILAHQLQVSAKTVSAKLTKLVKIQGLRNQPIYKVVNAMIDLSKYVARDHNILLAVHSPLFREILELKITTLGSAAELARIPRIAQRNEMRATLHTVLEKLAANPYSHEVKSKKWLRERVTQNETSLMYAEEREGGYRVFRRQGDIYSVIE